VLPRIVLTFPLVCLIAACRTSEMAGPTEVATTANGLLLAVSVPGRCLAGGCDPVDAEFDHLGLVTLRNSGTAKAFVRLCGTQPAIGTQQWINGEWTNVGPAVSCVFGPRSMVIAPHDSLQLNSFFAIGIWRLTVGVAADTALVTEGLSTSAPVVIK
jgi:hypothetical protein